MYTLTFKRSKSKHFQKALNHLVTMGGSWDGETATLQIPTEKILTAYEDLVILFQYTQKWESLKAYFMGLPVHPYRFIFQVWNTVNCCRKRKTETIDPRHCWSTIDAKGWGCKQLQRLHCYAQGTPINRLRRKEGIFQVTMRGNLQIVSISWSPLLVRIAGNWTKIVMLNRLCRINCNRVFTIEIACFGNGVEVWRNISIILEQYKELIICNPIQQKWLNLSLFKSVLILLTYWN